MCGYWSKLRVRRYFFGCLTLRASCDGGMDHGSPSSWQRVPLIDEKADVSQRASAAERLLGTSGSEIVRL
jgi:hypothetical protein